MYTAGNSVMERGLTSNLLELRAPTSRDSSSSTTSPTSKNFAGRSAALFAPIAETQGLHLSQSLVTLS